MHYSKAYKTQKKFEKMLNQQKKIKSLFDSIQNFEKQIIQAVEKRDVL